MKRLEIDKATGIFLSSSRETPSHILIFPCYAPFSLTADVM